MIYKKNEKYYCPSCKDHILTFNQDLFNGSPFSEAVIYQKEGQAPWKIYEKTVCRKCLYDFGPDLLRGKNGTSINC